MRGDVQVRAARLAALQGGTLLAFALSVALAAGSLTGVAPAGASVSVPVTITGTGFNVTPASNEVRFVHTSGAITTAVAESSTAGTSGRRVLTVRVPAGTPVGRVNLTVRNTASQETSSGMSLDILQIALPEVAAATQGAVGVKIRITGSSNVRFVAGGTTTSFLPATGITLKSTTIESATSMLVVVDVASSAPLGTRALQVKTSTQTALLAAAFQISAPSPPNRTPTAKVGGPYSANVGQSIPFNGSASNDPDGDPLTYAWDFGDGAKGSGVAPLHAYTSRGTFTVGLSVSDGRGGTSSATTSAIINGSPVARAGGPYAANAGQSVTLNGAASTDPDGDPLTYAWDFGDGAKGSGVAPLHTYTSRGAFTVGLSVSDGRGGTNSASTSAIINGPPVASAGGPYAANVGQSVTLNGAASTDPDGDPLTYTWDFGDGTQGIGASPGHTYTQRGQFTVRLTVADGHGNTHTASAAALINGVPTANPGGPYTGTAGQTVTLDGSGSSDPDGDSLTYAWDFGDGSKGTGPAPTHTYAVASQFTVTLGISDGRGGSASGSTTAAISSENTTEPTINGTISPAPNAAGWNNTNVTITFTCTDATTCAAPIAVSSEGAGQVFQGTAVGAGGTATTSVTVNIDKTAPVATFTTTPPSTAAPGDVISLVVSATDNIAVDSVALVLNGTGIDTRLTGPYSFTFLVPPEADPGSTFDLVVAAVDAAGNRTVLPRPILAQFPQVSQIALSVLAPTSPTFQSSQVLSGAVNGASGQTSLTIVGGASTVAGALTASQTQFGLRVPLRPNAENLLSVTATDAAGQTATARNLSVIQLTLTDIVKAQVTAQRLTTPEIKALVANGTINVADPANFHVSMFVISLTVGGRPTSVVLPVIKPVDQPLGLGPKVTISCQEPGKDIEETANEILVPCDDPGGGGNLKHGPPEEVELIPFDVDIPGTGGSVPGVILIEGKIKTLKEFFRVNLVLMNTSSAFTLSDLTAVLEIPDHGLSPVVPSSAAIAIGDIAPGAQGTGQFVIRGDIIGVHTVSIKFGGSVSGPLLPTPVLISGSASTEVAVKGPPTLDVTVAHPASVVAGEPYILTINIKNTSRELDALYSSLELSLGGADLLDPTTRLPGTQPQIAALGDVLAGQTVSRSYTVVPHNTGPITSCVAGATTNIKLSVVFSDSGLDCALGSLPSQTLIVDGRPTVAVLPAANVVDVSVATHVTAFFSAAMQTQTITASGPVATLRLLDPSGTPVSGSLEFAALAGGATAATFKPDKPLRANSIYTIRITDGIFSAAGASLASTLSASFTTGASPLADATAPTISMRIAAPTNALAVPQGQLLDVRVDTSDDSGFVERVDLRFDGELIDAKVPIETTRFFVDTSTADPGTVHTLTAIATDFAGNTESTTVSLGIVADSIAPTVSLAVASSALRGQVVPISIQAADNARVARVDLFLDFSSNPVYSGLVGPYRTSLNTALLADGIHQLRVVAIDGAGNRSQATASVGVRSLVGISVSPSNVALAGIGDTRALSVAGVFSDGATTLVTSGVVFTSSNEGAVQVSATGVLTSLDVGVVTVTVTFGTLPPAAISVTSIAGVPTTMAAVSGDNQNGTTGQPLAAPFVVAVKDAAGRPVPAVPVVFVVASGGGSVSTPASTTDAKGLARTTLTVGTAAGSNTVTAMSTALPTANVTFHASSKAPNRAPSLANPGNQSSGESVAASLQLSASDPDGDAVKFTASGLPPGLSLDAATGLISGTITATAGTYQATATATDGTLATSQSFSWTVIAPTTLFVDLAVTMTAAPNPVAAAGALRYTISVSNLGTLPATNVVLRDTLPSGVTVVSAPSGCTSSPTEVSCALGNVSGPIGAFAIVVASQSERQLANTVTLTSNEVDSAPANNTASTTTSVLYPPAGPGMTPAGAAADRFAANLLTWSAAGAMSTARGGTTLTPLADGKFLILGGIGGSQNTALSSGEIFDPATTTWSSSAALNAARAFHTATLLPNGDVLITGGVDGSGEPVGTTEIYRGPWSQTVAPAITWVTPAPVTYGTPLSSVQLNATANVPGVFVYTPASGTVLGAGTQTLSVMFVPADQTRFAIVVARTNVTIVQ